MRILGVCAGALMVLLPASAASAAIVDLASPRVTPLQQFNAVPRAIAVGQANAPSTPLDLFSAYGQFGSSTLGVSLTGLPGNWGCCLVGNSTQNISTAGAPNDIALADVNADGFLDGAVATDGGAGYVRGALNGVYTAFTSPAGTSFSVSSGVAFARLNPDALLDMVVATTTTPSSAIEVYVNTGVGSAPYNTFTGYTPDTGPVDVATGDFDGDGDQDVGTASTATQRANVFLNNGAGVLSASPIALGLFTRPGAVTAADVSGDARAELIVAEPDRGTVAVVSTGNLPTSLGPVQRIATGYSPVDVVTADLDGDGRPEVIAANAGSETVTVSEAGATRSFPAGPAPTALASGDVTGDGRPDVVVATEPQRSVTILDNLGVPVPPSASPSTPVTTTQAPISQPTTPKRSAKLSCAPKVKDSKVSRVVCTATLSDQAAAKGLKATLRRRGQKRALLTATARPGAKLTLVAKAPLAAGGYTVKLTVANQDGTSLTATASLKVQSKPGS